MPSDRQHAPCWPTRSPIALVVGIHRHGDVGRASSRGAWWPRRSTPASRDATRRLPRGYAMWYSLPVVVLELRFLVATATSGSAGTSGSRGGRGRSGRARTAARTPRAPRATARARACTPCASSRQTRRSPRADARIVPPVSSTNSLCALDERLAPQVVARLALFGGELLLDDVLRRDAGVVGARAAQSASSPAMRAQRMSTSCTVLLSPCPTCRTAVTFGGGHDDRERRRGRRRRAIGTRRHRR